MNDFKPAVAIIYANEDAEGMISKLVYQLFDAKSGELLGVPGAVSGVSDEERQAAYTGLETSAQQVGYTIEDIKLAGEGELGQE